MNELIIALDFVCERFSSASVVGIFEQASADAENNSVKTLAATAIELAKKAEEFTSLQEVYDSFGLDVDPDSDDWGMEVLRELEERCIVITYTEECVVVVR